MVATVGDPTPVVQLTPPTSEVSHVTVMSDAFRRGLRVKQFFFFRSQMPLGTFEGIKPGETCCAAIEPPLYPRMTYS